MNAFAAATARRMIQEAVREEERRIAERRTHPRGHGRRASDVLAKAGVPPFVVAPEPTYRVSGSDTLVPESATMRCPWCPKRGTCGSCRGSRRVLKNDGLHWPVAVVAVMEDGSEA